MKDVNQRTVYILIGFKIDVSSSMKVNMEGGVDKNKNWLRSIFDVADSLHEHYEITENNKIITISA